jgi:hypothetical protein
MNKKLKKEKVKYDDLKKFTKTGVKHDKSSIGKSFISINSGKRFTLSTQFAKESLYSRELTYVVLYYSKSKKVIVFDFVSKQVPGALALTNIKSIKKGVNFCAVAFINFHELDVNKIKGKYIPKLEYIEKLGNKWTIHLKQ